MSFCPRWIFEVACGWAGHEYLSQQIDLRTIANGYSVTLSGFYQPVTPEEIATVIEQVLRFLDELDSGDMAAPLLSGFCYDKVTYERPNTIRKIKGLFGNADDPVKNREQNVESSVKAFKAYVFALRNEVSILAPDGWKLAAVEDSPVISKLASQQHSALDFL